VADPSAYGLVRTDAEGAVTAFVEKPPPGTADVDTINAGTYVMEPDVLELIEPSGMVSVEREVFPRLIGAGLYARVDAAAWRDIGTPASYLAANLEAMPDGGLIDPAAVVDPAADVTESVIGADARIEAGASVRRSLVIPGAVVRSGARFDGRVIGRDGEAVW
jgi:mannose-1-phosphate guanylyltransferase